MLVIVSGSVNLSKCKGVAVLSFSRVAGNMMGVVWLLYTMYDFV